MSMEEEKAYGAPAEEAKEREGGKRRTLLAFLLALLLILGVIAALEFVPASPFEGLLRGWLEETQPAPSPETFGNPANDETSPAIEGWLATEQPEVTTVPPPSFPSEDAAADTADDGEGEEADAPDDPAASADPSTSVPSQDGSSTPGSGSTSGSPSSGSGTGTGSGSSSGGDSGSSPASGGSSSGGSGTGTGSGPGSGSGTTPPAAHTHSLAYREVYVGTQDVTVVDEPGHYGIVHHDAVYDRWDEPCEICTGFEGGGCGVILHAGSEIDEHMKAYGHNGWRSHWIHHEDLVSEAWDEEAWIPDKTHVVTYAMFVVETVCTECGEVIEASEPYHY